MYIIDCRAYNNRKKGQPLLFFIKKEFSYMLDSIERQLMERELHFLQDMKKHITNPQDPRIHIIDEHISLLQEVIDTDQVVE